MATQKDLLIDQETVSGSINDCFTFSQAIKDQAYDVFDLEVRLDLLETYWTEFREQNAQIQRVKDQVKSEPYLINGGYNTILGLYTSAKAAFLRAIRALQAPTAIANGAAGLQPTSQPAREAVSNNQASLEKLPLPRFDGNQADWQLFKDKTASKPFWKSGKAH